MPISIGGGGYIPMVKRRKRRIFKGYGVSGGWRANLRFLLGAARWWFKEVPDSRSHLHNLIETRWRQRTRYESRRSYPRRSATYRQSRYYGFRRPGPRYAYKPASRRQLIPRSKKNFRNPAIERYYSNPAHWSRVSRSSRWWYHRRRRYY